MGCCTSKKTLDAALEFPSAAPKVDDLEVILALENLHCINCVAKVEELLRGIPGVREARVNLSKKQVRVSFSSSEFGLPKVFHHLEAYGFPARKLTPVQSQGQARESKDSRVLLKRMAFAGCVAGNLMLLSVALYIGRFQGIEPLLKRFFELLGLALALPVVWYSGRQFLEPAWKALRQGRITIDVPIATGLLATTGLSVVAFMVGSDHQYFDTVTMFVFVLLIGRYLQGVAMGKVRDRLGLLLGQRPERVTIREGPTITEIGLEDLRVGQVALLETGEAIPADGSLQCGQLEVDESSMTGESLPVLKVRGDELLAGTLVFSGRGEMRVEAVGSATVLSRLGELVEKAQEVRGDSGRLSGKVAAWFSSAILLLALAVFFWWLPQGLAQATLVAVSVLVITCPCALGLSLPLAFWMAVRTGAERGVLVRDEAALETTGQLTDLVMDKTGTLTQGRPSLVAERFFGKHSAATLAPLVLALESESSHPFARSLVERFTDLVPEDALIQGMEVEEIPGRGRWARWQDTDLFIGRSDEASTDTGLDITLRIDGVEAAGWRFDDTLRADACDIVARLKGRGLKLHVLSGDRQRRTERVAEQLSLESRLGDQLPEDKAHFIQQLKEGSPETQVGVLGDGTNDALALSQADVGVAMGHSTAAAASSAPVLFLRPGLGPVLTWLDLGEAYRQTVSSSLKLSFLYNALAIPAAALGWVSPLLAAVAMPISSVVVVLNSLRLPKRLPGERGTD